MGSYIACLSCINHSFKVKFNVIDLCSMQQSAINLPIVLHRNQFRTAVPLYIRCHLINTVVDSHSNEMLQYSTTGVIFNMYVSYMV